MAIDGSGVIHALFHETSSRGLYYATNAGGGWVVETVDRPDVLVAYELEGEPLSSNHGGPARLYVAPMYGYKSLKWLERIELTKRVRPGYWEVRGYDVNGWVGRSNGRDDDPT